MSNHKRFLIGGVGGIAPVLMFLITIDLDRYFVETTTLKMLGYVIRGIALFSLGGLIGYLHDDELKAFKVFELGLAAPAMIAGFITTASINSNSAGSANLKIHSSYSTLSSAHAQVPKKQSEIKKFSLPIQTSTEQFFDGFLGLTPNKVWFVIVGSYLNVEDARNQADQINSRFRDYKAEVYAPYGENPYYAVVIGANLTQTEARTLRDKAIKAGFPKSSYYKTFPNLPPAEHL